MLGEAATVGSSLEYNTRAPVAVFVHVYYPEIWREISIILAERFVSPFRLVLTHTTNESLPIPDSRWLVSATQLYVENRGRDIRPFLQALGETPACDIGLKLHTKKSPQRADGNHWRATALRSLLPTQDSQAVITRLRADPRIGLVAPAQLCLSVEPWLLGNAPGVIRIMATLGAEAVDSALEDAYFAAGSMFWFRRAALESLTAPKVLNLFEQELGQLDGTIAHAMERVFPIEARRAGYVSLAMPALMESTPWCTSGELMALARRYADIPSTYFPGIGLPELPPEEPPVLGKRTGILEALLRLTRRAGQRS